jgi:hypothetical protein
MINFDFASVLGLYLKGNNQNELIRKQQKTRSRVLLLQKKVKGAFSTST